MLPADMPPARTMASLGWLIHCDDVVDDGDTLVCTLPQGGVWVVMSHEIDHLTDKGWIDMGVDEHVTVTARGVYWHSRWTKEQK